MTALDVFSSHRHREVKRTHEFHDGRCLVMNLGSIFTGSDYEVPGLEVLDFLDLKCRGRWSWLIALRNHLVGERDGNGRTRVMDTSRDLWLNFDDPRDAVLARLTFEDLGSPRIADRRGLPE